MRLVCAVLSWNRRFAALLEIARSDVDPRKGAGALQYEGGAAKGVNHAARSASNQLVRE
jgi:hypothetical protein